MRFSKSTSCLVDDPLLENRYERIKHNLDLKVLTLLSNKTTALQLGGIET